MERNSGSKSISRYILFAFVTLFIGAFLLCLVSLYRVNDLELINNKLQVQLAESEQIVTALQVEQERLKEIQKILNHKSTYSIDLVPALPEIKTTAVLKWCPDTKQGVLTAYKLDKPKNGKLFQLWVLIGTDTLSGGLFTFDELDHTSDPFEIYPSPIQHWFLTTEKSGGNEKPTLSEILVKSK